MPSKLCSIDMDGRELALCFVVGGCSETGER